MQMVHSRFNLVKYFSLFVVLIAGLFLLTACGNNPAGVWHGDQRSTLTLNKDKTFTMHGDYDGSSMSSGQGKWSQPKKDQLVLKFSGSDHSDYHLMDKTYKIKLDDDHFHLSGNNDEYDGWWPDETFTKDSN